MCPIVPILMCGLLRSNFSFAILFPPSLYGFRYRRSARRGVSRRAGKSGAVDRVLTDDLVLTKDALYQLSYNGLKTVYETFWWTGEDSNLRSSKERQVYSLLPLTARPPVLAIHPQCSHPKRDAHYGGTTSLLRERGPPQLHFHRPGKLHGFSARSGGETPVQSPLIRRWSTSAAAAPRISSS